MQKIAIDTGVREYCVNGTGVLRFNPGDPNLYHRFFAARQTLADYDTELNAAAAALEEKEPQARAAAVLGLLQDYDGKIKALLGEIFGPENDFDAVLAGVNLAGVGSNGKRVVENLLEALTPILQAGAAQSLQDTAEAEAAAAEAERAARANRSAEQE